MSWSTYCIISEISRTSRPLLNTDPVEYYVATKTNNATFQINNAKLYVTVVTLFINDNIKLLVNIKQGFENTISWNKFFQNNKQPKNNNLDYLINSTFRNINRLFVLSFKNGSNYPAGDPFDRDYVLLVEIKTFIALIDNKPFFEQQLKNKKRSIWKTYWNVKKWWLYNRTLIRLFASSKLLKSHWYRSIKKNKYKHSSEKSFYKKIRRRWWCKNVFFFLLLKNKKKLF